MEGITGALFRRAHHAIFGGVTRYYMPFLSPSQNHVFTRRELQEILPEHNEGVPAVPQLLTRRSEDFNWAAGELAEMGYREVNLNLGCPSGTVAAKGKGSGFLAFREELEVFLEDIFAQARVEISIKTRLGVSDPEEFVPLLELYRRFPLKRLIIHPRVQKDQYRGQPRMEYFTPAAAGCPFPVSYNGNVYTPEQAARLLHAWEGVDCVMLGRGLVGDPALARRALGGPAAGREELERFHDTLYEGYSQAFGSRRNAMMRMKELWFYQIHLFRENGRLAKAIRKAATPEEYQSLAAQVFRSLELAEELEAAW